MEMWNLVWSGLAISQKGAILPLLAQNKLEELKADMLWLLSLVSDVNATGPVALSSLFV